MSKYKKKALGWHKKKRKANENHCFAYSVVRCLTSVVENLLFMPRLELAGKVFNANALLGEQDNQVVD